jgi:hypothetical protein
MAIKIKKLDTRGGARTKKELSGPGLLLHLIWEVFGGPTKVARLLGVHEQQPVNWKFHGKVPLESVGPVARKLGVMPEALNYEEVVRFKGKGLSWREVVTKTLKTLQKWKDLSAGEVGDMLKDAPLSVEEILRD